MKVKQKVYKYLNNLTVNSKPLMTDNLIQRYMEKNHPERYRREGAALDAFNVPNSKQQNRKRERTILPKAPTSQSDSRMVNDLDIPQKFG